MRALALAALLLLLACGAVADCPEGQFVGDDAQCHACNDGANGGVWGCTKCTYLPGQVVATCEECAPNGWALDSVNGYVSGIRHSAPAPSLQAAACSSCLSWHCAQAHPPPAFAPCPRQAQCTQCGPNIKKCTPEDGDVALDCNDGYTLDTLAAKCVGNTDTCKAAVPKCTRCGDDGDSFAVCQECAPGHTLGYNAEGLDEVRGGRGGRAVLAPKLTSCALARPSCRPPHLPPPPLPQCKPCQEGCSLCQYDAPDICLPDSCFDGYAFQSAGSVCTPCHATCASCHWDPALPDGTICDDCKALDFHISGEDPAVVRVAECMHGEAALGIDAAMLQLSSAAARASHAPQCVENEVPPPCQVLNCDLCVEGEPGTCQTCHGSFLKQDDGSVRAPPAGGAARGGLWHELGVPARLLLRRHSHSSASTRPAVRLPRGQGRRRQRRVPGRPGRLQRGALRALRRRPARPVRGVHHRPCAVGRPPGCHGE